MKTLIEKIKIKIGGKEYKDYNFLHMVLKQELLKPNMFSFTMQKKNSLDSVDDSNFPLSRQLIGEKVTFELSTVRFDEQDKQVEGDSLTFNGIVFSLNVRRRGDLFSEQLVDVTAFSPDFLLMDLPHCFSYENKKLEAIVKTTLAPHDIPSEINPRTKGVIPYTVQYNESNYQFLARLARRFGEWMYNDGQHWIFGEIKKKDPVIKLEPRNDISNYRFQVDLMHHKHKHAQHEYLNYENLTKSDSDISELTKEGFHELTDLAISKSATLFKKKTFQHLQCGNPENNDVDELDVSLKAQLLGAKAQQVVLTGSTIRVDLTLGSVVELIDHYYDDEKHHKISQNQYIITSIEHSVEQDGNYMNNFTAVPSKTEYPPYYQSDIFPFASAQRAKVKKNDDEEHLGRVRVQFLWQEEQDDSLKTPWIRIAQPHGGNDKGFFFIPEIDEEVIVDFENGNAEKPYVVGTLYHGKKHPGEKWYPGNNEVKAIRTRSGHTVEIHDKGEGEKEGGYICIYDNKSKNYVLTFSTDEKLIELKSKGDIKLNAENDIILDAKNNVEIKAGQKITLTAKSSMELNGGGSLDAKADGTTTIKGAMVNIN